MATTNPLKEYWRNEQKKVTDRSAVTDTSKLLDAPKEKSHLNSGHYYRKDGTWLFTVEKNEDVYIFKDGQKNLTAGEITDPLNKKNEYDITDYSKSFTNNDFVKLEISHAEFLRWATSVISEGSEETYLATAHTIKNKYDLYIYAGFLYQGGNISKYVVSSGNYDKYYSINSPVTAGSNFQKTITTPKLRTSKQIKAISIVISTILRDPSDEKLLSGEWHSDDPTHGAILWRSEELSKKQEYIQARINETFEDVPVWDSSNWLIVDVGNRFQMYRRHTEEYLLEKYKNKENKYYKARGSY